MAQAWRSLIRPPFNVIDPEILVPMEAPVPGGGNIYLRAGIWIRVFDLEPRDTKDLADLHLRNAPRDWANDGNVSLCPHHDRPQRGGIRLRTCSLGPPQN